MRIRSIKPEFWTSEDIAQHDWPTRLLFIGLWSYVDDNGVGRDNVKLINADLFPLEDDPRETLATVSRGLQNLSEGGQITRYTVNGKPWLFINAWSSHQRIDKPNKARYPSPDSEKAIIRESVATSSRDIRETPAPGTGEQGNRGTGEQGKKEQSLSRKTGASQTDDFDAFWDVYEKKVGRKAALDKYRLALKKPGVTPELLERAAAEYIEWQKTEGKFPEYTKNASTWLNGEHWNDERVARRPVQSPAARSTTDERVQSTLAIAQRLRDQEQAQQTHLRAIGNQR